ncbi:MAG: hypothetical protein ACLRXM_03250 [Ruthenibacterium lactatiformans]
MLCAKNWREEAILSGIENILQRRFGTNAAESDTAGDTTRAGKSLSEAWFPSGQNLEGLKHSHNFAK